VTLTPPKTTPLALGLRMFSSLKSPTYRLYFFATIAHFAAMSMQIVSNPYLIYHLTDSKALLGTMSLVSGLPMIVVSIFGGAFADRIRKKYLLIGGMTCLSIISLLIAFALMSGVLCKENPASWWILVIASLIQGCTMGMMMPAIQAIIPELVTRDQLMNAIAMNTMGMTTLNLLAPVAAGYVIGQNNNYEAVYFIMTGCYLIALLLVFFLPKKDMIAVTGNKILADIRDGFRYMSKNAAIFQILIFILIMTVLSMPFQQLMPVFTDDILKVGPPGMGLLMTLSGVGALAGSLYLAVMPAKKRGVLLLISGIIAGAALTVFSFSPVMAISMTTMVFIGISQTFRNTLGGALLQTYTDNAYMGRVMSIMNMQWGVMSLFTFIAGVVSESIPIQWVLGVISFTLVVLSIIFLGTFKNVRKVE